MARKDFLHELISTRKRRNPAFRAMVEAARDRRRMLRRLAQERERLGLTQAEVAAVMGTSQSSIARIEAGKGDVKLSTIERYAATLGRKVEWRLAAAAAGQKSSPAGRRAARAATVSGTASRSRAR